MSLLEGRMEKKADALAGLFFILIGIGVMGRAIDLRIGTATDPKPGFFPLLGGAGLTILSGVFFVRSFLNRKVEVKPFGDLWRPLLLVVGLVAYVLTFNFLGYIIATFILSMIVLRLMDTRSWWVLAGTSLGLALASYFLFDRVLGVILPKGLLRSLF